MKIFKWRKSAPKKPEAFVLDLDRPRTLKYDRDILWALLRSLGISSDPQKLYDCEVSDMLPKTVQAGLIWEDPALTVNDVKRMIREKAGDDKFKLGLILKTALDAIIAGCGDSRIRKS